MLLYMLCFSKKILFFFVLVLTSQFSSVASNEIFLRDNLQKARAGDFIVIAQGKSYNLLAIRNVTPNSFTLEEITLPMNAKIKVGQFSWKDWVAQGAPGNTCWVIYEINPWNGDIRNAFSFSRNDSFAIQQTQNFLGKLLQLHMMYIPETERKKIGPKPLGADWRPLWQPKLIYEGYEVKGIQFDAWKTRWPNDGSELANKIIEVYLPQDHYSAYPAYFPYWLQVHGALGKAKIRIIDSGSNLQSPAQIPVQ